MRERKLQNELQKAKKSVLPEGCHGQVSARTQEIPKKSKLAEVLTEFSCPGRLGGLATIRTAEYPIASQGDMTSSRNKVARRNELDAIRASGPQVAEACGECVLGPQGALREQARLMVAGRDEIADRLALEQLRLETAQTQAQTEQMLLERARIEQQQANPGLPPQA